MDQAELDSLIQSVQSQGEYQANAERHPCREIPSNGGSDWGIPAGGARHPFVLSQFAPASGKCDKCAYLEGHPIHRAPVDHVARIADALERIAASLECEVVELRDRLNK